MSAECPNVEQFINEIQLERHWKEDGASNVEEFLDHIKKKLCDWTQQMTSLINAEKYDDHQQIVKEIVELRSHLDNIFPKVFISAATAKYN